MLSDLLILSDTGITLTDVYSERGEVLMGTLREERISEEAFERERQRLEFARAQRARAGDLATLTRHIDALQQEMHAKQEEISLAQQEYTAHEQQLHRQRAARQELRGGDIAPTATDDEGGSPHA